MKSNNRAELLAQKKAIELELQKLDAVSSAALEKALEETFLDDVDELSKLSFFSIGGQFNTQVSYSTDFWVNPFDAEGPKHIGEGAEGDVFVTVKLPTKYRLEPFLYDSSLGNTGMGDSIKYISPETKQQLAALKKRFKALEKKMATFAKQQSVEYEKVFELVSDLFRNN